MLFIISMLHPNAEGVYSVQSKRTTNPAKAYTLCKIFVRDRLPVNITVWTEVADNYSIPFNYICNSLETLDRAFMTITRDATKSNQVDSIYTDTDSVREEIRNE